MAKVDHGVYQKKIQRQKRANASVERGKMSGTGQKGMLLRGARGGRYQGASKDCIILIRHAPETQGRLRPHFNILFTAPVCSDGHHFLGKTSFVTVAVPSRWPCRSRMPPASNAGSSFHRVTAVWSLFCFGSTGKI